ncbi:ccr4 associated factor [Entomortierella beljakovae]|nr:ccr4 associated factor [Entomortierella beljakovae]
MSRIENGGAGFLAAFLSPKGRVMYDVFIHPTNPSTSESDPTFLIECDARALPELHKHIARFVLRSKVKLMGVTESFDIYSVLDSPQQNYIDEEEPIPSSEEVTARLAKMNASIGLLDNRAANRLGYRVIIPKGQTCKALQPILSIVIFDEYTKFVSLPENYKQGTLEDYHVRRITNGVPEGIDDFIAGTSLPLELNIDYMNGVDFRKGCYVGQELTIRTHHKGIIRKRVVPVQYYTPGDHEPEVIQYNRSASYVVPPQSELFVTKSGESTSPPTTSSSSPRSARASGKTGSNIGNIGLALVKLEDVANGSIFKVMDREGAIVRAKAFFPTWWPKQIHSETTDE